MRVPLVALSLLPACAAEYGLVDAPGEVGGEPVGLEGPGPREAAEDDTAEAVDTAAEPAEDEPSACDPGASFVALPFAVPPDELSCAGDTWVRFDAGQGLFVGVVTCPGTPFVRLYLSAAVDGPYLPALDLAGHGQDHCELLDPAFTLPDEDDINSGSCDTCATSANLPIEGAAGYARARLGEPFVHVPQTGPWSWQTSQLDCGVDPEVCVP